MRALTPFFYLSAVPEILFTYLCTYSSDLYAGGHDNHIFAHISRP